MTSRVYLQQSNDREPDEVRAGLFEQIENGLEAEDTEWMKIHKAIMGAPTIAPEYSKLICVLVEEFTVK